MINGLITAIRTLTILPVPGRDAKDYSESLPWFPFVGLLLGGILYGMCFLLTNLLNVDWPEGISVALLISGTLITRALHLDGLADWVDGFWGSHDRESVLEIMKDSATGAFGSIALVCILLAKWTCLVRLVRADQAIWIIAAYVISRTTQVTLAAENKYARAEGGTGSGFIGGAKAKHSVSALLAAMIILLAASGLNIYWLAALVAGRLATVIFGAYCRKRVGGITGDLLGANSELIETMTLAIGALLC